MDHINTERRIFAQLDHPFIVKFKGSDKDEQSLYLFMEAIAGGELFTLLRSWHRVDLVHARFYCAQVVTAFEYLHSRNLIYRDLKPENLLVDSEGYLKLTDFGLVKLCLYKTYTVCGTPEYMAPEVLLNKGHGSGVDWWTLGVFLYELLIGLPPFYDHDPIKMYDKIINNKPRFLKGFDPGAKELVRRLLHKDVTKRIGNLRNQAQDIRRHPFFFGFNWAKLLERKLDAPFVPPKLDFTAFKELKDDEKKEERVPKAYEYLCRDDDPFKNW